MATATVGHVPQGSGNPALALVPGNNYQFMPAGQPTLPAMPPNQFIDPGTYNPPTHNMQQSPFSEILTHNVAPMGQAMSALAQDVKNMQPAHNQKVMLERMSVVAYNSKVASEIAASNGDFGTAFQESTKQHSTMQGMARWKAANKFFSHSDLVGLQREQQLNLHGSKFPVLDFVLDAASSEFLSPLLSGRRGQDEAGPSRSALKRKLTDDVDNVDLSNVVCFACGKKGHMRFDTEGHVTCPKLIAEGVPDRVVHKRPKK